MSCCGKKPAPSAFITARNKISTFVANYRERLEICGNCTDLKRFHSIVPLGTPATKGDRCGKCNCYVIAKAALTNQKCPNGKW
ncbi:hypothetical protein BHC45_06270 [Snodgrassella alvi]|nr:hypothetical protein BGI08_06000 [Snodgrassella alvi]PIT44480.1 hypothetical protein BHC45_06270 [Snodgrassella alvi]PIT63538.1 hypothetical protein BHC52_02975 [Snodgrassella alvi]